MHIKIKQEKCVLGEIKMNHQLKVYGFRKKWFKEIKGTAYFVPTAFHNNSHMSKTENYLIQLNF